MRHLEAVYENTRHRIVDLLVEAAADDDGAPKRMSVAACPEWSAHDVVAHTTGICADIASGNITNGASPEWTAAQVIPRRNRSTREVLEEWAESGPKLASTLDDFPGRYGQQVVADLAVHEHDLRGALGRPGVRDDAAVGIAIEFLVTTVVDPGATALGVGPLEIHSGMLRWLAGTGEPPSGDPQEAFVAAVSSGTILPESGRAPAMSSLDIEPFELFRALTGRRSAAQVTDYQWSTDPSPFIPLFDLWPFHLREDDLVE